MARTQALQDERDFLVVQLSIAEEERAAAAQNAAVTSAEVQQLCKLNNMHEVGKLPYDGYNERNMECFT